MKIEAFITQPYSANCYVVENNGETAVVDCGEFTEEIKNRLDGVSVKYIFLTHGHADHILGVYYLKQAHPEATVVIHEADSEYLTDGRLHDLDKEIINRSLGLLSAPYPAFSGETHFMPSDKTAVEGDKFDLGGLEITVLHTPGHSAGSACYFFPQTGTIFTGDTLFCLTVGRTDLTNGSDVEMLKSITRLYNMDSINDIYPGHNRATTMEYEKRRNRYMRRFK